MFVLKMRCLVVQQRLRTREKDILQEREMLQCMEKPQDMEMLQIALLQARMPREWWQIRLLQSRLLLQRVLRQLSTRTSSS